MDDNLQFICFAWNSSEDIVLEDLAGVVGALIWNWRDWEHKDLPGDTPACLLRLFPSLPLSAPDILRCNDTDLPSRAAYNLSRLRGASRQSALMERLPPWSTWIPFLGPSSILFPLFRWTGKEEGQERHVDSRDAPSDPVLVRAGVQFISLFFLSLCMNCYFTEFSAKLRKMSKRKTFSWSALNRGRLLIGYLLWV